MKILLVDDNNEDARQLCAILSDCGSIGSDLRLLPVLRLEEALEQLRQAAFDVVLLDLSLPDTRGLEAVGRMREVASEVPIVVLTGTNDEETAIESVRGGAEDYLVKGQIDSAILARSIRYAIERKRVAGQIRKHQARQAALHEINLALTSTLDLQSVVKVLLEKIAAMFPRYAATLRLLDPETGNLGTLASSNVDEAVWREMLPVGARGLAQLVLDRKSPVAFTDAQSDPHTLHPEFLRKNGLVSYLGVPLINRDEAVGVLNLYTRERHEFDSEEIEFFATLGGQAAIAIHNSRLFEQLYSAKKALEKSVEIKSVLMGVMAHELKTPIQVIIGNANLLSDGFFGELTEEQRQRVRTIETGADELLHLIESALDMTRFDQGKMPLAVTEIPVNALLAELKSEFEEAFRRKGVELHVSEASGGYILKSDRVKLKEILRNLLENARKFTAKGKVEVQFSPNSEGQVEFLIKDTGIGIDHEALPKIFELFYQVDPAGRSASGSAGLGLNIVKRLLGAMSGNINVTSEVGKGSTFRVVLPKEIASVRPGSPA